jgi:hypothetical protein
MQQKQDKEEINHTPYSSPLQIPISILHPYHYIICLVLHCIEAV